MYTIYLALFLFGTPSQPQACHAEVKCPTNSTQCEVRIKTCAVTLEQCLQADVVMPDRSVIPVLGCQNKPNPKTADVDYGR